MPADKLQAETGVAATLRLAEQKAAYDAACKRLLSHKPILAQILKGCVKEFADCSVQDIAEKYIEGEAEIGETPVFPDETNVDSAAADMAAQHRIHGDNTEDASMHEGTVRFDIRFRATAPKSGERVGLIINIEAQNDFHPGYPLVTRGIYYASRLISSQYEVEFSGSRYGDIKKVYSIWVCIDPPEYRENTIVAYSMTEQNLLGQTQERPEHYDLLTVVMICLSKQITGERNLLRLLEVALSDTISSTEKQTVLEAEYGIPMLQEVEQEVQGMCNLSDGVYRRGINDGITQGIEQNLLENIRNLMDTLSLNAEQAMNALKVPTENRAKLMEKLS